MAVNLLPVIDLDDCISCNLCVEICPDQVLSPDGEGMIRVMAPSCMGCGHCYAICPVEAISIPGLVTDLGLETLKELRSTDVTDSISIERLLKLMRFRRSCRRFKPVPPAIAELRDLVRIGTTAPSGTNSQGWQFLVLPERQDVINLGEVTADFFSRLNRKASNPLYRFVSKLFFANALDRYYRQYYNTIEKGLSGWYEHGVDRLFHGAPSAIVVVGDRSSSCPGEDGLLATQNILLAAEAMGLATCLIGFVVEAARRDQRIPALLRLGANETIYSVIACGYSALSFKRAAGRKPIHPRIVKLSGDKVKETEQQSIKKMEQQKKRTSLVMYSFGFKHGVPVDANMVWDVRFLPNPYWQEELRPMNGCEEPVSDYVIKSEQGKKFLTLLKPLLTFLVDGDGNLEKKNLRVAIGCTGGRHRSVAVVEELRTFLADKNVDLTIFHRDMERE